MTATARIVIALVLGCVAVFGVQSCQHATTEITVKMPSEKMIATVADVHRVLARANPVDRALWAQVWSKSAKVVQGDATDTEVVFTDTRALRAFQILAVRIAWRRLGENGPSKYPGLAEAVEKAFADTIGMDVKPVTPEVRQSYVDLCNALAWCGAGRG